MQLLNKRFIIKSLIVLLFLIGQGSFCLAQTKTYEIDVEKSTIAFKISNLGILMVVGNFHNFSGSFIISNDNLQSIESEISVGSIDTKDKSRDKILVDEAYLDMNKHPTFSFYSTKINNTLKSKLIIGMLKIKDVEKEISMPFKLLKDGNSFYIKISTTLSRKEFKLDFGGMNSLIGDVIKIELEVTNSFN